MKASKNALKQQIAALCDTISLSELRVGSDGNTAEYFELHLVKT